ncbi:transposase [Streptomyces sp. 35G-GA-8]|uniref:transposase n=1 Tax=Streptomyces sp. 35G-GA-8 TaxID=2939434 RepID=UPI00201F1C0C|nr:transposase [Streptomyces sp. 35G-GA-8]MCL7382241.1 transposase [Streptomyces sp. 35G-GA-8]
MVVLTSAERRQPKKMAHGHKTPHQARQRATVVPLAARGRGNARITAQTHLHADTVRTSRGRFAHGGIPALADRKRSGRPARFPVTPIQVAEDKAVACRLPAETGVPLARRSCDEDEYVISDDEKTPFQARCHPTLAPGQTRAMRGNHTYGRGGALAYLAAYDVHHAKVFGRCEPRTRIAPFMNLVTQVMSREPYASATLVYRVVDNGSSYRGKKAANRLATAFPNAVLVHTPVHASWLNQTEVYFSVVQRKVVPPNDVTDLAQVAERLRAFEDRYDATAQPFQWKFTTSDLNDLLTRLHRHTADHPGKASTALAARPTHEGLPEPTTKRGTSRR